jgi:hypothetical protein
MDHMLNRFILERYCKIDYDYQIDMPYIHLHKNAASLVSQYYADKYSAEIIVSNSLDGFIDDLNHFISNKDTENRIERRVAFVVAGATHSLPVIYLKHNDQECFLCADSLGTGFRLVAPNIVTAGINRKLAQVIYQKTQLQIFIVENQRQADLYSCLVDALVFARDCVGRDHNNQYHIPNLFMQLQARSIKRGAHLAAKLPDELLKTSQISKFTNDHQETVYRLMHQGQTLVAFKKRYELTKHKKTINTYLQAKSIKLASLIEIQFYSAQLKIIFKHLWTAELSKLYNKSAKLELAKQGDVFLNTHREGLYDFTLTFYTQHSSELPNVVSNAFTKSLFSCTTNLSERAELLVNMVMDKNYWHSKCTWGLPVGISAMQKELSELVNTALPGKIHAIREIAKANINPSKGFLYLIFGMQYEFQSSMVKDFYKIFLQDWRTSPLFKKFEQDWKQYKTNNSLQELRMV